MLSHKPSALVAVAQDNEPRNQECDHHEGIAALPTAVMVESIAEEEVTAPLTKAEKDQIARHARRQARFERVNKLYHEGHSIRAISRQMGLARHTVSKYIEADVCPQYTRGVYPSKLAPWLPYLEKRWQAGFTNATQLWREIRDQGFSGSRGLVSRWAAQERKRLPRLTRYSRQQPPQVKPTLTKQARPIPWSPSRASWLLVKGRSLLDNRENASLKRMVAVDPQVWVPPIFDFVGEVV